MRMLWYLSHGLTESNIVNGLTLALGCSLACLPPASAPQDRDELRATLKATWDSLEGIEFLAEEYDLDSAGKPIKEKGFTKVEYAFGPAGRRKFVLIASRPEGDEILDHMRQDGRRIYASKFLPGQPGRLDQLVIRNQEDRHDEYTGPMTQPLWLFTPGGRPLYALLDESAEVRDGIDEQGRKVTIVEATHKGTKLHCELDPEHDYLPLLVRLEDFMEVHATEFGQDDGRWFPVAGRTHYLIDRNPKETGFRVDGLKINQPLDPANFDPRPLPPGVSVSDHTTGKGSVVGGLEARRKLKPAESLPAPPPGAPAPIVASSEPDQFPWSYVILLAAASVLIGTGVVLYRRRGTK